MELKHTIFRGALWAGAAKVLAMGCSFLLTLVLARGLSPSDFGQYNIALSTVAILVNVGTMGMDRTAVRFLSIRIVQNDGAGLRRVLITCIGTVALAAAVVALAFHAVAASVMETWLHAPGLVPCVGIMAIWLFFATVQGEVTESFRGLNDIRMASLLGGIRSNGMVTAVGVCGAMAVLTFTGKLNLERALWVMVVVAAVIVGVGLARLNVSSRRIAAATQANARPPLPWTLRQAFGEAWPYWIAAFIVAIQAQGGMWLAGALDTTSNVARFSVAQRLILLLSGPMIIGNMVLPPIIAQLHAAGQIKRMERVIRSVSGLILLPSLALTLALVFGGKVFLQSVFGPFYATAYPMLVILCVGQVFNVATGAWQTVLPMTGNQRLMLVISTSAMVTLLVSGLILGRLYGVMGVAVGVGTSVVVSNLVGMFTVRWRLGLWTFASLDPALVGAAVGMLKARIQGRRASWQDT